MGSPQGFDPTKPFQVFDPSKPFVVGGQTTPAPAKNPLDGIQPPPGETTTAPASKQGFFSSLWDQINPMGMLKVGAELVGGALVGKGVNDNRSPIDDFVSGLQEAHHESVTKAVTSFAKAQAYPVGSKAWVSGMLEATGHAAASQMPFVGAGAEKAGEQFAAGNIEGGAGTTAGLLLPFALHPALKFGKNTAAAIAPKLERAAVESYVKAEAPTSGPNVDAFIKKAREAAPTILRDKTMGAWNRMDLPQKLRTATTLLGDKLNQLYKSLDPSQVHDTTPVQQGIKDRMQELVREGFDDPPDSAIVSRRDPEPVPQGSRLLSSGRVEPRGLLPEAAGASTSGASPRFYSGRAGIADVLDSYFYDMADPVKARDTSGATLHPEEQFPATGTIPPALAAEVGTGLEQLHPDDPRFNYGAGTGPGARMATTPDAVPPDARGGPPNGVVAGPGARFVTDSPPSGIGPTSTEPRPEVYSRSDPRRHGVQPPVSSDVVGEGGVEMPSPNHIYLSPDISVDMGKLTMNQVVSLGRRAEYSALKRALSEITRVGKWTNADTLRSLAQDWGNLAKPEYNSTLQNNLLKPMGTYHGWSGAERSLRNYIASDKVLPEAKAANAEYSLYRKAEDASRAMQEAFVKKNSRTWTIGGGILGAVEGLSGMGHASGLPVLIGLALDAAKEHGYTTQIATARAMTRLSDALTKFSVGATKGAPVDSAFRQLWNAAGMTAKEVQENVKSLNKLLLENAANREKDN